MGEQVVELARALADQMREHLALLLARQIGAGRRRRQIELRRVARMLGHGQAVMSVILVLALRVGCFSSKPFTRPGRAVWMAAT